MQCVHIINNNIVECLLLEYSKKSSITHFKETKKENAIPMRMPIMMPPIECKLGLCLLQKRFIREKSVYKKLCR